MGQPRKSRKKYNTPPHPWNAERIKNENKLMTKYGLKNKKEIWKADTLVEDTVGKQDTYSGSIWTKCKMKN